MKKKQILRSGAMLAILASLAGCTSAPAQPAETAKPAETVPAPLTVSGRPEETNSSITPAFQYRLSGVHEVNGRQGIACDGEYYYVSGSTLLEKYDRNWKLVAANEEPFADFETKVNHLGDIDVYNGEIYAGAENFNDGAADSIQIAVYDAETLKLKRTFLFDETSGQNEVSGIAADPANRSIWMCSWADGESGRYLYRYDMETGAYMEKLHLQCPPQWIQGIAVHDGSIYISADDGTADLGEPDHIYRCTYTPGISVLTVTLERTLDDVALMGEIEGLTFDSKTDEMLVSYNRGSQIVLGMVKGFYEGYDREIHEIYSFASEPR